MILSSDGIVEAELISPEVLVSEGVVAKGVASFENQVARVVEDPVVRSADRVGRTAAKPAEPVVRDRFAHRV
jgi:hypothetical protein